MHVPIRSPDGQHGVIVVHAFAQYHEADFLDDPQEIEQLVTDSEGWRIVDAVRLDGREVSLFPVDRIRTG